jgi:hypothetical protein
MERLILENQVSIMRALGLLWGEAHPMRHLLSKRIDETQKALAVWSVEREGSGDGGQSV